jgi:membrane protein involved in colicin uptake
LDDYNVVRADALLISDTNDAMILASLHTIRNADPHYSITEDEAARSGIAFVKAAASTAAAAAAGTSKSHAAAATAVAAKPETRYLTDITGGMTSSDDSAEKDPNYDQKPEDDDVEDEGEGRQQLTRKAKKGE